MTNFIIQLERLQAVSGLLRQIVKFLSLVRCIEDQLLEIDRDNDKNENNNKDKSAQYLELATNLSELGKSIIQLNNYINNNSCSLFIAYN